MTYPNITETFEGGAVGAAITTANTFVPRIDNSGLGGSVFATGGVTGQCANPVAGNGTGSTFFDTASTDTTSTIVASDWVARARFEITDTHTGSDPGYVLLEAFLGEVGRTPANWLSGTTFGIDLGYNFGDKTFYASDNNGAFNPVVDATPYLNTWIELVISGTNGSYQWSFHDSAGTTIASGTRPCTANLYRARVSASAYRDDSAGEVFKVDNFSAVTTGPYSNTITSGPAVVEVSPSSGNQVWVDSAKCWFVPADTSVTDPYTVKVNPTTKAVSKTTLTGTGFGAYAYVSAWALDSGLVATINIVTGTTYRLAVWHVDTSGVITLGGTLDYDGTNDGFWAWNNSDQHLYQYQFDAATSGTAALPINKVSVSSTGALGTLTATGSSVSYSSFNGQFLPTEFCDPVPGHAGYAMVRQQAPLTTLNLSGTLTALNSSQSSLPVSGSALNRPGHPSLYDFVSMGTVAMGEEYGGTVDSAPFLVEKWSFTPGTGFACTNTWTPPGGTALKNGGNFWNGFVYPMGDGTFMGLTPTYSSPGVQSGYVIGFDIFGTPENHTVSVPGQYDFALLGVTNGAVDLLITTGGGTTAEVHTWARGVGGGSTTIQYFPGDPRVEVLVGGIDPMNAGYVVIEDPYSGTPWMGTPGGFVLTESKAYLTVGWPSWAYRASNPLDPQFTGTLGDISGSAAIYDGNPVPLLVTPGSFDVGYGGYIIEIAVNYHGVFDDFAAFTALGDDPILNGWVNPFSPYNVNAPVGDMTTAWTEASVMVYPPKAARFVVPTVAVNTLPAGKSVYLDAFDMRVVPFNESATLKPTYQAPRNLTVRVKPTRLNLSTSPHFTANNVNTTLTITPDATHTLYGPLAGKVSSSGGAASYNLETQDTVEVVPDESLWISYQYYTPVNLVDYYYIRVDFLTEDLSLVSTVYSEDTIHASTQNDWTQVSLLTVVPPNATRARVYRIYSGNHLAHTTDTFWVDGSLIERSSTKGPFFDGSFGTDYLWEQGGTSGATRSYYYQDREARNYILTRVLQENVPLGMQVLQPQYAVYSAP